MDLESLNRILTAVEIKSMVNYSSTAGTAYQLVFNNTTLTISSDGSLLANDTIIADNLAEDNEERLQAVERFVDNVEFQIQDITSSIESKADKDHTHEISEINGLQEILDNKADVNHTHTQDDITDLSTSSNNNFFGDFSFLLMTDLISSYINTALK